MIDTRTKDLAKDIKVLQKTTETMKVTKQDKSNFQEQRQLIQGQFDDINNDTDTLKQKMSTMEHFIDKYIPIRVQKLIGESIASIGSHSQLQRFQNYEMEKYKKLNLEVLEDETNSDLKLLMEKVA